MIIFNPQPIHERCVGCERIIAATNTCKSYENPSAKWEPKPGAALAPGIMIWCPLATHFDNLPEEIKQKINPIKASKRAAGVVKQKKR
jgi:hypothetical protein